MTAYRVYYDFEEKKWKHDDKKSEVDNTDLWFDVPYYNIDSITDDLNNRTLKHNESFMDEDEHLIDIHVKMKFYTCKDCKQPFLLTSSEYFWYKNRNLTPPKRCSKCRHERKLKMLKENL